MLKPNQTLQGRYQCQRPLGRTATGRQTWLALDLESSPPVPVVSAGIVVMILSKKQGTNCR
ncbi:MAG: hypothetical protein ACFB8W_13950 [Elainellaceae cyanobacterium]